MKLCDLCSLCENEEKENCLFRPYKVNYVEEIHTPDDTFYAPLFLWRWECSDFITKTIYGTFKF